MSFIKKLKYLVLTLFVALMATGCGAKPEDVLKEASENMKKLDNYHMDLTMDMDMSYEGTSLSMSVKAESDIDVKNGQGAMETSVSFFGMSEKQKSYFTTKDGKTTTYMQEDDEWYKEVEEDKSNEVDFDIFANASSIEKLKDEKNTYKITLSEDQIKELLASTGEAADTEEIDLSSVTIKITVEDKRITKMVMEMDIEESKCTFTLEFSKFNEVKVEIPQEVIDEAIEYDEDDYDFDYDYE